MEGIAQIKDAALIEPGTGIQKFQRAGGIVDAGKKKTGLDAVGDVGGAVRIEIVFELERVPDIAGIGVRAIGGTNGAAVEGEGVEAVPKTVAPVEIPGAAFSFFPGLHMDAAFLETVESHDVRREIARSRPAAAKAVEKPGGRVKIDDRKFIAILRNIAIEATRKRKGAETRGNFVLAE